MIRLVEVSSKKIIAYHGSYTIIKRFDKKFSPQGVFWFTENKDDIKSGNAGALSTKHIMTVELTVKNVAGRTEYELLSLHEIKRRGFDSIKLGNIWAIFDSKNIKILHAE